MSGQPYSDKALDMATVETSIAIGHEPTIGDLNPIGCDRVARAVMTAAHDREALGLDASVCARTLADYLRETYGDADAHEFEGWFQREFGGES